MKGYLYWSAYNNIVETIHMDAAPGRLMNGDANACGSSLAIASRDAKATPELFVTAARQFLATADALHTCTVSCDDYREYSLGFETKRDGEVLYVTRADADERLTPGMRVVAVGRNAISFLLKDTAQEIFGGRGSDRENWDLAMRMFDDIDVFPGDGHVVRLPLEKFPLAGAASADAGAPCAEMSVPAEGVALLSVRSLADAEGLASVLSQAAEVLSACDSLVLDLRRCPGEADPESWLALLAYLVDGPVSAHDLFGDEQLYTIYSKRNAEHLTGRLEQARAALETRGQTDLILQVDAAITDVQAKAQQVLEAKRVTTSMSERRLVAEVAEVAPSPFDEGELVEPAANAPQRVAILVDDTCGYGAERLAQAVMGMQKVQLVGRATAGLVDYANYLTVDYPEVNAHFTYPISRTQANREGRGYARSGLPLDVHVPFTPEECTHDAILARAIEALQG